MSTSGEAAVSHSGAPTDGVYRKWLTMLCVSIAVVTFTMEGGISTIMAPALLEAFSSDISTVVWFFVVFMVTSTGLMFTIGWLGDVLGRRRMYLVGFVIFTVGLALISVAQNLVQLYIVRVIQGIGMAFLVSNGLAIITAAFPKRERGRALGLMIAMTGVGFVLGSLLGGLLLEHMDWRAVYWARIPVGVVGFLLALRFLPEQRSMLPGPLKVDYLGIVLLYATATAFLLAVNQAGRLGFDSPIVWCLAIATGVLMPILIFVEQKAARPILDLSLFRNRVFAVSQASMILHFIAFGALNFLVPFYLLSGLGVSSVVMGIVVGTQYGGRIVMAPLGGFLYDKFGSRLPTVVALVVMAIGMGLLSIFAGDALVWQVAGLILLIGIGQAVVDVTNASAIMGTARPDRLGAASSSVATFAQISLAVGATTGGAIFATRELVNSQRLGIGGLDATTIMSQSVRMSFSDAILGMVVLVVLAAVVTWFRGRA